MLEGSLDDLQSYYGYIFMKKLRLQINMRENFTN